MNNIYSRILRKLKSFPYLMKSEGVLSYSQIGEDKIVYYLFQHLGIQKPTYIDIGAYCPILYSNTFFFYERGSKGVCVEPDPTLYKKIKKTRTRDVVINAGIGIDNIEQADFYIFQTTGWNTFSKEEAEYRKSKGQPYEKIIKMPLININDIFAKYFTSQVDLISIDVEGLDFDIIKSLDYNKYAPKVIILETIRFGQSEKAEKQQNMIDYVVSKGYMIYADTYVNTIFLKN